MSEYKQPQTSAWGWGDLASYLWSAVRQRCPRCRKGKMFRGVLTMNDPCPVCGLIFQREEGYFLGAMYVSYLLSSVLLTAFYFTLAALLPDAGTLALPLLALVPYLPFVPVVFRYSRVFWVYLDRWMDPTGICAGPYEKFRQRCLNERQDFRSAPRSPAARG
jgi:uncharacterized protein (DUF983 family)